MNQSDPSFKKKNRTRSKARRTNAIKAHIDPQARIKSSVATPSKRGRESGDTPPSANRPNKKLVSADQKSSTQTVGGVIHSATVPPAYTYVQSSGSANAETNTVNNQTVTVPPVINPITQLPGSVSNQSVSHNDNDSRTYASVSSSLCAAIVDQRTQGSINLLDQKRFDQLSSLITDKMISEAGKNIKLPEIDDSHLFSGVMRIRCANVNTRQWLEKYIPALDNTKLWAGAKLTVMDFNNIVEQRYYYQKLECFALQYKTGRHSDNNRRWS